MWLCRSLLLIFNMVYHGRYVNIVFGGIGALLAATLAVTFILDLKPQKKMVLFRFQVFLLFFLVMCAVTRFVWVNLIILLSPFRQTVSKPLIVFYWLSYAALVAFVVLALFSVAIGRLFVGVEPYFITKLAFICLGLLILMFFNLCVLKVVLSIVRLFKFTLPNVDMWKSVIAVCISVFLCIHGFTAATSSDSPRLTGAAIPVQKLGKSLDRTTIMHLSDIHIGPMVGKADVSRVVDMVSIIYPDIVVITGDLVDSTVEKLKQAILPFKKLRSKYGTFFVTGNHEYYTGDVDEWFQELKKIGIQPLHNSYAFISSKENPQDKIYLAGVDDIEANRLGYEGHGMNLSKALGGKRSEYPTILLAHQPKTVQQALKEFKDIDLILCGHTHGGQFFPMHIPVYLFNPIFAGIYTHKMTHIYVSSGTFFYGVPLRIGSKSEMALITLVGQYPKQSG